MANWIEMDVFDVFGKVAFVFNFMFPKSTLPNSLFSFADSGFVGKMFEFIGRMTAKFGRINGEGMTGFDSAKGLAEQIDGLRCGEKLLPLVGDEGEEVCTSKGL
jgi:hypothetical protein